MLFCIISARNKKIPLVSWLDYNVYLFAYRLILNILWIYHILLILLSWPSLVWINMKTLTSYDHQGYQTFSFTRNDDSMMKGKEQK